MKIAPRPRRIAGYTLIEVVVAFALLAFGMALLLGALSNASRQIRVSTDAGRAALHAQTLLDQVGVGRGIPVGHRDGELDDGRYHWAMEVSPYRDPTAPPNQPPVLGAPQLMQIDLRLTWGSGARQRLDVRALRLVTPININDAGLTQ